jgi:GMP synthase-like glutamine amidotransferase
VAGRRILGIRLGAQLIVDILGARVSANRQKEIGWFPVTRTEAVPNSFPDFFGSGEIEVQVSRKCRDFENKLFKLKNTGAGNTSEYRSNFPVHN